MKSFSGVFTVSLATECFAFLGHLRQDQSIVKGDCAKKNTAPDHIMIKKMRETDMPFPFHTAFLNFQMWH